MLFSHCELLTRLMKSHDCQLSLGNLLFVKVSTVVLSPQMAVEVPLYV